MHPEIAKTLVAQRRDGSCSRRRKADGLAALPAVAPWAGPGACWPAAAAQAGLATTVLPGDHDLGPPLRGLSITTKITLLSSMLSAASSAR